MKKFVLSMVVLALLFLQAPMVYAAAAPGAVTITAETIQHQTPGRPERVILTLSWLADAGDGTVPVTTIDIATYDLKGYYLYEVDIKPGTVSPTDDYDIVISDTYRTDICWSLLLNRDTTTPEQVFCATTGKSYPQVYENLTVTWTNQAVHAATGTLILIFTAN